MVIEFLTRDFSVCQIQDCSCVEGLEGIFFLGRTDGEISLVCETAHAPAGIQKREDGWRAFRAQGTLNFSLVGILARLSGLLAENGIGIFAVSTYDTDYILFKRENENLARRVLKRAGCEIV